MKSHHEESELLVQVLVNHVENFNDPAISLGAKNILTNLSLNQKTFYYIMTCRYPDSPFLSSLLECYCGIYEPKEILRLMEYILGRFTQEQTLANLMDENNEIDEDSKPADLEFMLINVGRLLSILEEIVNQGRIGNFNHDLKVEFDFDFIRKKLKEVYIPNSIPEDFERIEKIRLDIQKQ